jgi:capsular polysaccharide export protein
VINSTVGLQALMRHKPLMVMGDALYDRPGLSHQGLLHDFWADCPAPETEQVDTFLHALIALTQAPCNVYGRADEPLLWTVAEQPLATTPA